MQPNEQRVHETVVRLRASAEESQDAVIEDDLLTGKFRWANTVFLEKTGYKLTELAELSAFDVIPTRYHGVLQERLGGKRGKFFVAPIRTARGTITWWFASDIEEIYPIHWSRARYLTETDVSDPTADIMMMLADVTNITGEALFEHETVHDWVRREISRLDGNDSELRRELAVLNTAVTALRGQVAQAASASRDAANAGLRACAAVQELKEMHSNLEARVSSEILRLIGTDKLYENQLTDFKAQLNTAAARATNSIQEAAKDAGKTISFKISFPVGVVGGLAVIVNYLLTHPELIAKLLHLE